MGLEELQPGNTLRAKATAVAAFSKFLKGEEVEEEFVRKCIEADESGKSFVCVMDKFGMYLAFSEGKKGKLQARNTAMQYYRQAKIWLLEQFPQHRASLESRLLKMGKTLDSFCLKRDGGGFVTKAPPSSDLSMIKKRNISIDAADVFFLRLVRVKTSEAQGLSLFPDADFSTCPLLAVALALSVQAAPSPALIDNLPDQVLQTPTSLSPDVPLVELLNAPPSTSGLSMPVPPPSRAGTAPTVYAHVNRVLGRVCLGAGVSAALTSHSFRRGGAQHANGCEKMTARWIFDRGSWNLSIPNKGFNYIFNTSREDHMIAKVLSGYKPSAAVHLQDLSSFDADTLDSIARFQRVLFAACYQLEAFNINRKVLDVLTACLVRHYPVLKDLNPKSPAVNRLETCVAHAGRTLADLLAWSAHLAKARSPCKESEEPATPPRKHESNSTEPSQEQKIIENQAAVIKHLIKNSKRQDAHMDMLEAKINGDPVAATHKRNRQDEDTADVSEPKKKQRRGSATHLHAIWFTWYAQEPRWYENQTSSGRNQSCWLRS
ncbi:hypothetical protein AM587_10007462 [Phytophthora nicotianae]|uniref:Uncharacterized protein n=1 Tax=Phytophthora nicotianae TaxID=4792 RepID=A0A0W8C171_PHYNI|nr:hypothetical protein AM587_10007462 [Phytophthora nicotianae]